jgi:hypothetical protein
MGYYIAGFNPWKDRTILQMLIAADYVSRGRECSRAMIRRNRNQLVHGGNARGDAPETMLIIQEVSLL